MPARVFESEIREDPEREIVLIIRLLVEGSEESRR
jgi:hypothetical protein